MSLQLWPIYFCQLRTTRGTRGLYLQFPCVKVVPFTVDRYPTRIVPGLFLRPPWKEVGIGVPCVSPPGILIFADDVRGIVVPACQDYPPIAVVTELQWASIVEDFLKLPDEAGNHNA